jgi:hypothetical protein
MTIGNRDFFRIFCQGGRSDISGWALPPLLPLSPSFAPPICNPQLFPFPFIIQRLFPFPPISISVHQLRNSNVMSCNRAYTRHNLLGSRNRLDNRLYRIHRLPTRWPTGWPTGCIVYTRLNLAIINYAQLHIAQCAAECGYNVSVIFSGVSG